MRSPVLLLLLTVGCGAAEAEPTGFVRKPVALPDNRWDKMVYGVRDCEEFLRAVM